MSSIDNVEDVTPRVQYAAANGQTSFPYPFPIFEDEDLVVNKNGVDLALDTDYTVDGEGNDNGGDVTLTSGAAFNDVITIYRALPIERSTDFQQNGPWSSAAINDELNRVTLVQQQLDARIDRCIQFDPIATTSVSQNTLSPISGWLGKFLQISSQGVLQAADLISTLVAFTQDSIGAILYPQTTTEAGAGVTPVSKWYKEGNVRRYAVGNIGDGSTDATAALTAAWSLPGVRVRLPKGNYKITSSLPSPVCGTIEGDGFALTKITVGTGVTLGLNITPAGGISIRELSVYGNATNNAVGVVLGSSLTGNIYLENVQFWNFTGTNAIALQIKDAVGVELRNCYLDGSYINLVVGGGDAGFPTTVHMYGGAIREAATCGVKVTEAYVVGFHNVTVEANRGQGLLVQTAAGRKVEDLAVDGCWFEDNYFGHTDTGTDVYSLHVDGASGLYTSVNLRDLHMSQGSVTSDRKSILLKDTSLASISRIRASFGFLRDITVKGSGSLVLVQDDSADRMGRFMYNPDGGAIVYPLYAPVIDTGSGASLLPVLNKLAGITYSASMTPDCSLGDQFVISASNGTAFTINAPLHPRAGQVISIAVRNASGGALGVATWNAVFKLAAWTQASNGFSATGIFRYDGSNWVQIAPQTTAVPN